MSPDGNVLICGSRDNSAYVYEVASAKRVKQLKGHTNDINAVLFSPEGDLIATASDDYTVRVWDAKKLSEKNVFSGHDDYVGTIAFSTDGTYLISGSDDCTIRIWDLKAGQEVKKFNGHKDFVWSLAISPTEPLFASGSRDGMVMLWSLETMRPAGTLAVIGDLKQMKPEWLRGTSMLGYGTTLTVGIGLPIPILSEEILSYTAVSDAEILAPVVDYSEAYPQRKADIIDEVSYSQLKSGSITVNNKNVPTSGLSSYSKALAIANQLKDWIKASEFLLAEPVAAIPGVESGIIFKPLAERKAE